MKIAILEPYIKGIGGAQRIIADYSLYLQNQGHYIEIFTPDYDPENCYPDFKKLKVTLLKSSFKVLMPLTFKSKNFKDFDLVITNDWPSNFASINNSKVIWVCYSPKRDFYDLKEFYLDKAGIKGKITLFLKSLLYKNKDKKSAENMKEIFGISRNVQERIKKYYGLESKIFYPGIYFNKYKSGDYKDYILSVARFVKPKRVEMIIGAMKLVKNKKIKLYVIGSGPNEDEIKKLCEKQKNIVFLGSVDDNKLKTLYSNCLATVYIPKEEDWGLIPIEAAAAKKTTIGCNEGGLKETIVNDTTGFLLDKVTSEKLAEKIDLLANNKKLARKMGQGAFNYCKKFDWKNILPDFEHSLKLLHNS